MTFWEWIALIAITAVVVGFAAAIFLGELLEYGDRVFPDKWTEDDDGR